MSSWAMDSVGVALGGRVKVAVGAVVGVVVGRSVTVGLAVAVGFCVGVWDEI
jgi:hypothetical protein